MFFGPEKPVADTEKKRRVCGNKSRCPMDRFRLHSTGHAPSSFRDRSFRCWSGTSAPELLVVVALPVFGFRGSIRSLIHEVTPNEMFSSKPETPKLWLVDHVWGRPFCSFE